MTKSEPVIPSWKPNWRTKDFDKPVDFFARRIHFIDHLAPMWNHLDPFLNGTFYVPAELLVYTKRLGLRGNIVGVPPLTRQSKSLNIIPSGYGPIVTCAYGDMMQAYRQNMQRPQILMEHGVGLSFPEHSNGYAGGGGIRTKACLFLPPNEFIRAKTARTFPNANQVVIGTPKMDKWFRMAPKKRNDPPTVAIAFHWDGSSAVCPEAGNALEHYVKHLKYYGKNLDLIGHGHPKIIDKLAPIYQAAGIEVVTSFEEVLKRADLYINDSSSTLYEFSCVDRPVVILNAPWFRRDVDYGIRWWDYTDIGPQCNSPDDLLDKVKESLEDKTKYAPQRRKAVKELYPFLGESAHLGGTAISDFVKGVRAGKIQAPDL